MQNCGTGRIKQLLLRVLGGGMYTSTVYTMYLRNGS